jgi:glyoxylase-like metal-dependent hydrolase (beta-lactamase superfamily II)
MKVGNWALLATTIPLAIGAGLVSRALLPERWTILPNVDEPLEESPLSTANLPPIDVTFLRCGLTVVPELVAVRGGSLIKRVPIAHSAVLVRHPDAMLLYDTGLCEDISRELTGKPFVFRQTLARFTFERSLRTHLDHLNLAPSDLRFALLSHLHWDHVSGIPDLPGVRLRINRVEHEAAQRGLLDARRGLVRQLMRDNPIDLFDCAGPAYEGFPSSYDLFGDGTLVLVPLPGHTAGNTGMFVNRSNGPRLLLIGDAAWVAANYLRPATMHPLLWSAVTSDDATARRTLLALRRFSFRRPDVALIAMHDAAAQAAITGPQPIQVDSVSKQPGLDHHEDAL